VIKVIGAGLPRTGTMSLRLALQQLLGGTCYHMSTLFERNAVDVPRFRAAARGEPVDWSLVFDGCTAAVDWPAAGFWQQLAEVYPDALIVLSEREDAATWWRSADATVWAAMRKLGATIAADPTEVDEAEREWFAMDLDLMHAAFGPDWDEPASAMRRYDEWNASVRATVAPQRLVEWRPGMGWGPLCDALRVDVPDEPFPHVNTTEEFVRRVEEHEAAADADAR
jgi:Sulfotransferase domain